AIEDRQVFAGEMLGLLSKQLDSELAFRAKDFLNRGGGQLRLPKVQASGLRQEPSRLAAVVQEAAQDHPVVGTHGRGSVGTASGVFVEGAGAPDILAGAMHLGVIDGGDTIAIPERAGSLVDKVG